MRTAQGRDELPLCMLPRGSCRAHVVERSGHVLTARHLLAIVALGPLVDVKRTRRILIRFQRSHKCTRAHETAKKCAWVV